MFPPIVQLIRDTGRDGVVFAGSVLNGPSMIGLMAGADREVSEVLAEAGQSGDERSPAAGTSGDER